MLADRFPLSSRVSAPLLATFFLLVAGSVTAQNWDNSDGDGFSDAEELATGADALDASSNLAPLTSADFNAAGGYTAYLAEPANTELRLAGICDEASAFSHWRDFGSAEGRLFSPGKIRTDSISGSPDPDYGIDGGFAWEYPGANTVVFITADAPKPAGWAGLPLLLERCQTFNIGSHYSAQTYRAINTDVRDAIDQGLVPSFQSVTDHYVKYGFKEGRLTTSGWTEAQVNGWNDPGYLTANPDVANYFQGAANSGWSLFGKYGFAHWINFGQYEGRPNAQLSEVFDRDGDGIADGADAFPDDASEAVDTDGDGTGDNADTDDDGDGLSDSDEAIAGTNPLLPDTDGDGVSDLVDNCPRTWNPDQLDSDQDDLGDVCDAPSPPAWNSSNWDQLEWK